MRFIRNITFVAFLVLGAVLLYRNFNGLEIQPALWWALGIDGAICFFSALITMPGGFGGDGGGCSGCITFADIGGSDGGCSDGGCSSCGD